MFTAKPPRAVSLYLVFMSAPVSRIVLMTWSKLTVWLPSPCKAMRAAKIKLGANRKTCQYSAKIYDSMPSTLSAGTRANMLSEIRKAINEGKAFSHNPGRAKAAKKKGAKTGGSGTIMITVAAGDKAVDAASKLRKGFNKIKAANDGLAELAAYLLDALDEAGFPGDDE